MSRIETIGDCTLYLGDCMEIMPMLGKVDAVVTDPPYGIGADIQMHKKGGQQYGLAAAPKRTYANTSWDSAPASKEHISAIMTASKYQIIFGGNYFDLPPSRCWLVWDKKNGGNCFADCELAWTNLDKPVRRIEWMWNGMLRKGQEERNDHPTQKPVGVMEWCINNLPDRSSIILDPFMGSGTTLVACAKMGRKGIGIELDERYFDIACERVRKAYDQPDMFVEPPEKPTQAEMVMP